MTLDVTEALRNDTTNHRHHHDHHLDMILYGAKALKEKKTQSKCMFRLGDDDIESPYKKFLDTFDFFV